MLASLIYNILVFSSFETFFFFFQADSTTSKSQVLESFGKKVESIKLVICSHAIFGHIRGEKYFILFLVLSVLPFSAFPNGVILQCHQTLQSLKLQSTHKNERIYTIRSATNFFFYYFLFLTAQILVDDCSYENF